MLISKPESEGWLGKYQSNTFENYQLEEYKKAMAEVKNKRVAIDLGANLGIMSYRMCRDFEYVHAFEPLFADHLKKNVQADNIKIYPFAVGEKTSAVEMRVGLYHSGGSNVVKSEDKKLGQTYRWVTVVTVDSYDIQDVDFIKIDVEDYEWYAIQGSKKTIEKYKPVVLMELKKTNPFYSEILKYMTSINYTHEFVGEFDCIFKA